MAAGAECCVGEESTQTMHRKMLRRGSIAQSTSDLSAALRRISTSITTRDGREQEKELLPSSFAARFPSWSEEEEDGVKATAKAALTDEVWEQRSPHYPGITSRSSSI